MDIRPDGRSFLTKSEAEWLGRQSARRSGGGFNDALDTVQQKSEEALTAAREQFVAEHGILRYATSFGKNEQGSEVAVIEVGLDRVELEILLDTAEQDHKKRSEYAANFDEYFEENIKMLDDSDPENAKNVAFGHQIGDINVMAGIIAAIKPQITDQ